MVTEGFYKVEWHDLRLALEILPGKPREKGQARERGIWCNFSFSLSTPLLSPLLSCIVFLIYLQESQIAVIPWNAGPRSGNLQFTALSRTEINQEVWLSIYKSEAFIATL